MSIFNDEKIYWIGPRESDISAVKDLLAGSITLFGSNENGNYSYSNYYDNPQRIDHNNSSIDSDLFLVNKAKEIVEADPNVKFMFYNGNIFYAIDGFIQLQEKYHCFYCVNDISLMKKLNDKHYFHDTFETETTVLNTKNCNGADCDYHNIQKRMKEFSGDNKRFIFQAPIASGGSGTFILDEENEDIIARKIDPDANYLVSVYQEENISVNIHAIIYSDDIILTPGSIQIMREDDYRLMYRGADFIAYRSLNESWRIKFEYAALKLCKYFQQQGYRGVCGIDAIFSNENMYLLEVNNRFQASTNLLNMSLKSHNMKTILELNYDAFTKSCADKKDHEIKDIEINYSNYTFIYNGTNQHCEEILQRASDNPYVKNIDLDGFHKGLINEKSSYEKNSYLFRINFNTNIVWINEESTINLNENIIEPTKSWMKKVREFDKSSDNLLAFKVALMMQGVVLSEAAKKYLSKNKGFREATNNAIDLKISNRRVSELNDNSKKAKVLLVVNAPIDIKFVEFSPFVFDVIENESTGEYTPILKYYDENLMCIRAYSYDKCSDLKTKRGIPYSKVAFLSTDRLRIQLTNNCRFKEEGKGCKFCNMSRDLEEITIDDIKEVVEYYHRQSREVRHYLIGGQSEKEDETDKEKIVEVVKVIRKINPLADIYAMILPCSLSLTKKLCLAGVNQIAHNIEIFDEECAEKYMPGKAKISRKIYFESLNSTSHILKRYGDTRSLIVVGLEKEKSLFEGIRHLAVNHIQPILSVFRPLPGTPLENVIPPSMENVCRIYYTATNICEPYGMMLGPDCPSCQNNTLSLSFNRK